MKNTGLLASPIDGPAPDALLGLSPDDEHHLQQLENKLQLVRDRTAAVVHGYGTGLYLHGDGGVGKSYTVLDELQRLDADFQVFNSRMTGRGLFDVLEQFPTSVHVLEDMESLTRDRGAQGVLRSSLWAQRPEGSTGPLQRTVTWTIAGEMLSFVFTGGIIMIANRPLADVPELQAIKTRITCMHLQLTAPELRAMMRSMAAKGFTHNDKRMEPAECREVCEYLIRKSAAQRRSLDLRLLQHAFADYLQWQEGDAGCHWQDAVTSRLQEKPTEFQQTVALGSRALHKQEEQMIVRGIVATTADREERNRLWTERTGKSEPTFYRRLAEVNAPRGANLKK